MTVLSPKTVESETWSCSKPIYLSDSHLHDCVLGVLPRAALVVVLGSDHAIRIGSQVSKIGDVTSSSPTHSSPRIKTALMSRLILALQTLRITFLIYLSAGP